MLCVWPVKFTGGNLNRAPPTTSHSNYGHVVVTPKTEKLTPYVFLLLYNAEDTFITSTWCNLFPAWINLHIPVVMTHATYCNIAKRLVLSHGSFTCCLWFSNEEWGFSNQNYPVVLCNGEKRTQFLCIIKIYDMMYLTAVGLPPVDCIDSGPIQPSMQRIPHNHSSGVERLRRESGQ